MESQYVNTTLRRTLVKIVIEGNPIPWDRAAPAFNGKKVWMYDTQKPQKALVRRQMLDEWNKCYDNPNAEISQDVNRVSSADVLVVSLTFLFLPYKNASEALKNAQLWGFVGHNQKPDFDNLAKFYLDCGNKVLWSDDKIIDKGIVRKDFSNKPRTIIEIMTKEKFKPGLRTQKVLEVFGPDKLSELADDIKAFDSLSKKEIYRHSGEGNALDKGEWQYKTAMLLSHFAMKYANDLSKLNNYKHLTYESYEFPPKPLC